MKIHTVTQQVIDLVNIVDYNAVGIEKSHSEISFIEITTVAEDLVISIRICGKSHKKLWLLS